MKRLKGFTIVELMLAMGFLSTLLITIALLVNMILDIYNKGLSLRAVNSTGRQLIDDISRVVSGSPIQQGINPIPTGTGGTVVTSSDDFTALRKYFFSATRGATREQRYGTFCTGSFSYIWNTQPGYALWRDGTPPRTNTSEVLSLRRVNAAGTPIAGTVANPNPLAPPKFVRVADATRNVCVQAWDGQSANSPRLPRVIDISADAEVIELINTDETDLILYDFTIFPASQHSITQQTFYSGTFILATMRGGVNISTNGDFCNVDIASPLGLPYDFDYCAVNKFNFAMRATGFTKGGN